MLNSTEGGWFINGLSRCLISCIDSKLDTNLMFWEQIRCVSSWFGLQGDMLNVRWDAFRPPHVRLCQGVIAYASPLFYMLEMLYKNNLRIASALTVFAWGNFSACWPYHQDTFAVPPKGVPSLVYGPTHIKVHYVWHASCHIRSPPPKKSKLGGVYLDLHPSKYIDDMYGTTPKT